uniref:Uncharacterized protein n=1 Tax=Rhizophora mucronata TaxID=61149 RepID=A0A2P2R074_RHIMU
MLPGREVRQRTRIGDGPF